MDETQERFLRAIAEQIAPERIVEVHLFSAIRQGPNESRVAVIAAEPEAVQNAESDDVGEAAPEAVAGDMPVESASDARVPRRLTIYRAQYRLVLKGADRGTWTVSIAAEADAPIETVSDVVRGVRERAGEDVEPERLTGDAIRAVVTSESWTGTR
jgi:hypothetical protein